MLKLSVKLIDTYNHINKVYYDKKTKNKWDDKNWDYIVRPGERIHNERCVPLRTASWVSSTKAPKA